MENKLKTAEEMFKDAFIRDSDKASKNGIDFIPFTVYLAIYKLMEEYHAQFQKSVKLISEERPVKEGGEEKACELLKGVEFMNEESMFKALHQVSEYIESNSVETDKWISVKNRLPGVGQRVIFRAVLKWNNPANQVSFFDDELTGETEPLEYGGIGYCLKDNNDYLAVPHDTDYCDEIVTDWQPVPLPEPPKQ